MAKPGEKLSGSLEVLLMLQAAEQLVAVKATV